MVQIYESELIMGEIVSNYGASHYTYVKDVKNSHNTLFI